MNLLEFEHDVLKVALSSSICDIPIVRRLRATSINIRVNVIGGGFIDVFYNEHTGTTAFALIMADQRAFGADNTGGWHIHPFENPEQHLRLPQAMSFGEFVAVLEQQFKADS